MVVPSTFPVVIAAASLPLLSWGQEALPAVDPPKEMQALARHTSDDRKRQLNQSLELSYQTAGSAWKLVHACVKKDVGQIQALKVGYSREVRRTRTEEKWKQYELMIQAFHLHHAGEFREFLRDDLLKVAAVRETAVYAKLPDGVASFDAEATTGLLSGACAAAVFPSEKLPYTHACVHKSLDRFSKLTLDPVNDSQSRVVAINAVLQCALVTGRLAEFRNEQWRAVFDDLRDLLPPNGRMPRFGNPAWNDVFGDWGAALRIGAVLFNDPSYAYAANKYQAAMEADPEHAAWRLSPVQWGFINYATVDKMPLTAPPTRSVVQRSYRENSEEVQKVILRTGHHPRAAFLMIDPPRTTTGTSFNARSAPKEFWVGGSLLTPTAHQPAAAHNIFMVTPPDVTFPARESAPARYTASAGLEMLCDDAKTFAENRGDDAYGKIVFSKYIEGDSTLTRRLVLTREGILVIADRFQPDPSAKGFSLGPIWNLAPGDKTNGRNWVAYEAFAHHLPPGYAGTPRAAMVWFAPQPDSATGRTGEVAFQKAAADTSPREFLTVVVPFPSGVDPRDVAAVIKADELSKVTVGKVTIEFTEDSWRVTGNGSRASKLPAQAGWKPAKPPGLRKWTDRTGRELEGEVLGAAKGMVELKLANGETVTIPYARLSEADQAYLKSLRAR